MVELNELINRKLHYKFLSMEDKLRNSFQAIKQENQLIRHSLDITKKKIEFLSQEKVFKSDFEKELKNEMDKCLDNFKQTFSKLEKQILEIKKDISDKEIKSSIKKELSQEIRKYFSELSKKHKKEFKNLDKENTKIINQKFDKYKDKAEYLRKEFIMFKNEFIILRQHLDSWKKDIGSELKDLLESDRKRVEVSFKDLRNQIISLKARNTILTREVNSLKRNGSAKLIEEINSLKKKRFLNKTRESV